MAATAEINQSIGAGIAVGIVASNFAHDPLGSSTAYSATTTACIVRTTVHLQ